jgi:hypothetical protein
MPLSVARWNKLRRLFFVTGRPSYLWGQTSLSQGRPDCSFEKRMLENNPDSSEREDGVGEETSVRRADERQQST